MIARFAAVACFVSAQAGVTAFLLGQLPSVGESSEALILLAPAPLSLAALLFGREAGGGKARALLSWLWRPAAAASLLLLGSLLRLSLGFEAPRGWFLALIAGVGLFGLWIIAMNGVALRRRTFPGWLAVLGVVAGGSWSLVVASALLDAFQLEALMAELQPLWSINLLTWLATFPLWAIGLGLWCWGQGDPDELAAAPRHQAAA
jgi:hypothetical protein